MMKSTVLGLVAISVVFWLLTMCTGVEGCTGGRPAKTYLDKKVHIDAGRYSSDQFEVTETDYDVNVTTVPKNRFYILNDAEMSNLSAGKNFTAVYNSSKQGFPGRNIQLTPGKYWAVVDNRASSDPLDVSVKVQRPYMAYKCGAGVPIPGFEAGPLVLALFIVGPVALVLRERKN